MPSVALRILRALRNRLKAIDGHAPFENDLEERIHFARPSFDLEAHDAPAAFIYRPVDANEQVVLPSTTISQRVLTLEVAGVIATSASPGEAVESLLADLHRALEVPDDLYLRDVDLRAPLLDSELLITSIVTDTPEDGFPFETVVARVQCAYTHKYGDPEYVQPNR